MPKWCQKRKSNSTAGQGGLIGQEFYQCRRCCFWKVHSINTRQLKLCRVPKTADSLPKCLEMSAHVFWLSLSFQHFRSCVDDRSVAEVKLRRRKSSCRQVLDLPVLRKSAQERSSDKILTSAIGHFHSGWSTRDDSAVTSCTEPKGTQCGPGMLPVAPSGAPKLCAEAWPHLSLSPPFPALFAIWSPQRWPRGPAAASAGGQTDVGPSVVAAARRRHRGALRHHAWQRFGGPAALGLRDDRGCGREKPPAFPPPCLPLLLAHLCSASRVCAPAPRGRWHLVF